MTPLLQNGCVLVVCWCRLQRQLLPRLYDANHRELDCVLHPQVLGAACKTRLEPRMEKFNPVSFMVYTSFNYFYFMLLFTFLFMMYA